MAAALLDGEPGLESFTDAAVRRPAARRLMQAVGIRPQPGGEDLLAGQVSIELELDSDEVMRAELDLPPGAPGRPFGQSEIEAKLAVCAPEAAGELARLSWEEAPAFLRANGYLLLGS